MDFFYTKIENSGPTTARIGIKGHAPLSQFLNSSFILQFRIGGMTQEELDKELRKGIESIKEGKTFTADEVDEELAGEFGI